MNWDIYFLGIAKTVSKNTKCISREVGAVLVKDKAIISTGYNGPPRGIKPCWERSPSFYWELDEGKHSLDSLSAGSFMDKKLCPRRMLGYKSGEGLFLCSSGHAERNALIQAARNGISTLNTTLYCWCALPCLPCMVEIINAGVKRLVYLKGDDYNKYSRILLEESGIEYTEYYRDVVEKEFKEE